MSLRYLLLLVLAFSTFSIQAKDPATEIVEQPVTYSVAGVQMKGYIAYDKLKKGKRPGVLVVHEWWGCNEYARRRARMLAALGYMAFAVDLYGDGKIASTPKEAGEMAMPFYEDPAKAKVRIEAAVNTLKRYRMLDDTKMAAIGYCFGGGMVLNMAKMGMDFKAVVSFHGSLSGVEAIPGSVKGEILVCHGGADRTVSDEDIKNFKQNLDSVKAPYIFKVYADATHAFTNPDATAIGKKFNMPVRYHAEADAKSWKDMEGFLKKVFSK